MNEAMQADARPSTGSDERSDLLKQYGCGPIQFSGTDDGLYERHLLFDDVVTPASAGPHERYRAVAHSVRDILSQRWVRTEATYDRENPKRVYYLSMEFLIGRSLSNNITNLLLDPVVGENAAPGRPASKQRGNIPARSVMPAPFTRHPSSGVAASKRGTYGGLIEKIPYLQDLGVSAVELLPVFAFDEEDGPPGLGNYWGYQPLSFFAPDDGYSSRQDPLGALDEFRDMVKALHRAGIEVILDVVYNHTTEGKEDGPTICFRGLANDTYYILAEDKSRYADYTGCGNTLNANEPIVRRLILDSLRYWVSEMHIDGFRFDLASILTRDQDGRPMASPPVLWDIESDPILANVKLIAEAWDAAGLYQVGRFVGDSWKEWNGRFRDDVRAFLKGDNGTAHAMAFRLTGSPDVYQREEREAEQSINFVTCHDGFTLNDLVSFNGKHNEANGEENRDGADDNLSWNCGVEGPTAEPEIERLRNRQVKNFLTLTLLAIGTPMLLMGDEVRRTQGGNNNSFCQNTEISWFDWNLVEKHADIHRFVQELIALRLNRDLPVERLDMTLNELLRQQSVQWHGVRLNTPDWSAESHTLAATVRLFGYPLLLHIMINAFWEPLEFEILVLDRPHESWRRCIDTYLDPPDDICGWASARALQGSMCRVEPRSLVLLLAKAGDRP